MSKAPTLYVCKNPACQLGASGQLGKFTSGLTALARHLKTGEPLESLVEGEHYGEGFCPNVDCMQPGEKYDPEKAKAAAIAEAEEQHAARIKALNVGVGDGRHSAAGKDPHDALHQQIAARVADPEDPLTADDAQQALLELVEEAA